MTDLKQILDSWNCTISELETAISERQPQSFKRAYQKGCQSFKQLQVFLDTDKDSVTRYKNEIKQTSDRWLETTNLLKPWMQEVKEKLDSTKQAKKQNKKVGKIYAKPKKAGINLSVKAR